MAQGAGSNASGVDDALSTVASELSAL